MKNIASKVAELNSQINKLDLQEDTEIKVLEEEKNKIYNKKSKTVRAIEAKFNKLYYAKQGEIEKARKGFATQTRALVNQKEELLNKIRIVLITENLVQNEKELSNYEVYKLEPSDYDIYHLPYFLVTTSIFPNKNKVNKFSYFVTVLPKHDKIHTVLEDEKFNRGKTIIFSKDFKTINEAEDYHIKNFDKICEPVMIADIKLKEMYEQVKEEGIDLAKEFDFRLFDINLAGIYIKKKTKNIFVVEDGYGKYLDKNKPILTITHVGDFVFQIDSAKKTAKDLLRNVLNNYTNDIWVEKFTIKVKK